MRPILSFGLDFPVAGFVVRVTIFTHVPFGGCDPKITECTPGRIVGTVCRFGIIA